MSEKKSISVSGRQASPKLPVTNNVSFWVGVVTSIATVGLAIYTGVNKGKIDQLETELNTRHEKLEETKEKIERYKWVFSMYKDLTDTDERKSKFSSSLITLALSDTESTKLFGALSSSSDKVLQNLGRNGFVTAENSRVAALVAKFDTTSVNDRINAVGELEKNYASSNYAITSVLELYNPDNIKRMSGNGLINGLYYLNTTNPKAWNPQQIKQGKEIADRLTGLNPGDKTISEVNKFRQLLSKATSVM
ncbi:MAG: hypothetical protein ACTHMI_08340 [Mucilaginibacter sp.]